MTRAEAVNFLLTRPAAFGRLLGFTKLRAVHNKWLVDMIRGRKSKTLQGHRGSFKTTCLSIALAVIMILLPNKRILFMRKTDDDVKEVIRQVQKILTDPRTVFLVQCIYGVPLILTTANATELSTNLTTDVRGTSQLVGMGIGGSLTGKHFDFIFTDDIVNLKDRVSKAERDRTKMIYQELANILNPNGRIFNTGTPWHKDDAFSLMPAPEKYDCYSTGLLSKEQIDELKQRMLPSLFAANYELRHIAAEDVIFDNPAMNEDAAKAEQGYTHIDAAFGGQDYTALTICKRTDGVYYIFGKLWHKGFEEVMPQLLQYHRQFNSGRIYVEDNGDKGFVGKMLRNEGERVSIYHEDMNKFVKITSYLKSAWNNVRFVTGTDADYIAQICDYNENAEHDDAPDSAACMMRIYSRKGENEYKPLWN